MACYITGDSVSTRTNHFRSGMRVAKSGLRLTLCSAELACSGKNKVKGIDCDGCTNV